MPTLRHSLLQVWLYRSVEAREAVIAFRGTEQVGQGQGGYLGGRRVTARGMGWGGGTCRGCRARVHSQTRAANAYTVWGRALPLEGSVEL